MEHNCGEKYNPPVHTWAPRVPHPKVCPRCKTYLKYPNEEKGEEAGDGSP